MSNDAAEDPTQQPSAAESTADRPEQHGPEMDDDQVAATNELDDQLPPVDPDQS